MTLLLSLLGYFEELPALQYGVLSGRVTNFGEIEQYIDLEKYFFETGNLSEKTILDIGCGPGTWSLTFGLAGAKVLGIDPDKKQIEFALRNKSNMAKKPAVYFDIKDAAHVLKYTADNTYDYIFMQHSIEHMDAAALIPDMKRVLKPNGRIWIACPNKDSTMKSDGEGHIKEYSKQDLLDLFKDFKVIYAEYKYTEKQVKMMQRIDGKRKRDYYIQRMLSPLYLDSIYRWFTQEYVDLINKRLWTDYFERWDEEADSTAEQIYMVVEKNG